MLSPLLMLALAAGDAPKPKKELLWPKGAPGAVGTTEKDKPTLTAYLPAKDKRNGTAAVVCPGGGYGGHAIGHEGKEVAEWLNQRGICAFVLEYRLGPRYRHPAPLQDAQRAIRLVRSRAKELALDAKKVGIWGFSAGGHLASCAATIHDKGDPKADDPAARVSCRPDFAILCYPVITMELPTTHAGSRKNLLGDKPADKLVRDLSTHTRVTKDTPPVFLFHTRADNVVVIENSDLFARACKKAGVPVEYVVYEKGPHGVGLGHRHREVKDWPARLEKWLKGRK
jgi:acetyl esterase/lipase